LLPHAATLDRVALLPLELADRAMWIETCGAYDGEQVIVSKMSRVNPVEQVSNKTFAFPSSSAGKLRPIRSVAPIILLMLFIAAVALAQGTPPPRALIVVAHPDDESCLAATAYEITHNLGGTVDELIITNGEGGYRYSLLANSYYDLPLTDEPVGRAALPEIRKREAMEAGRAIGITNHFFLDERDLRYTQDIDEVLNHHWDAKMVLAEVARRIRSGHYDFVFTLFPAPETHGAHKAATITALEAVAQMPAGERRPVVLGCQLAQSASVPASWKGFQNPRYPFTALPTVYRTDRSVKFGFHDRLNYQIIVSWLVAAYKSQGAFQAASTRPNLEEFVVLESGATESGSPDDQRRTSALFHALAAQAPHPKTIAPGLPAVSLAGSEK
jgi:LmbE family N-acetylglucosaminyl deacetylase